MKKLLCLILLIFSISLFADDDFSEEDFDFEEKSYETSGSFKIFNQINHYFQKNFLSLEKNKPYGSNTDVINLKFKYFPTNYLTIDSSYHIGSVIEDNKLSLFRTMSTPNISYRIIDFDESINNENSNTRFVHNINRLNIKLNYKKFEITLGRQAISKGSSKFVNPIDLFSAVSFQNLNNEEKRGIDALRIRYSLGNFTELDLSYVFGKHFDFEKSSIYLAFKSKLFETDMEFIIAKFYKNYLFGLDISRDIEGILFYLEGAFILTEPRSKTEVDNFIKLSLGLNYKFSNDLFIVFEYHFNQKGSMDNNKYLSVALDSHYKESGGYLLSKHYLMLMISYPINIIFNSSFKTIVNLNDPSFVLNPHLDYNLQENLYIDLDLFFTLGKSIKNNKVRSEFSLYPSIYSLNLRYYF